PTPSLTSSDGAPTPSLTLSDGAPTPSLTLSDGAPTPSGRGPVATGGLRPYHRHSVTRVRTEPPCGDSGANADPRGGMAAALSGGMRTLLALLALALAEVIPLVAHAEPTHTTASVASHGADMAGRLEYESPGPFLPSLSLELRAEAGHDDALLGPLAT